MNPRIDIVLRTLKASLETHVIPELESDFARGQAGQIAVTLEWLAQGWEPPLQELREGNANVRRALDPMVTELERLAQADGAARDRWLAAAETLRAALEQPVEDTLEDRTHERERFVELLDALVREAGTPVGGNAGTGPLWTRLHAALEALTHAETTMGPIPLPEHHWR